MLELICNENITQSKKDMVTDIINGLNLNIEINFIDENMIKELKPTSHWATYLTVVELKKYVDYKYDDTRDILINKIKESDIKVDSLQLVEQIKIAKQIGISNDQNMTSNLRSYFGGEVKKEVKIVSGKVDVTTDNDLILLLKTFPHKNWNYNYLSENPNITMKYVKENPDKDWSYKYLSLNPNITMEDVKLNPDKEWNYYYLSRNPNITMKDVKLNPDKEWNYNYLSQNPNITMKDVKENPNKNWNYDYLSRNPNITMKDVKLNPDKDWDYKYLSLNPNITMKDVKLNPDIKWHYCRLSLNPNITAKEVKENSDKEWDYGFLSQNKFKHESCLKK